MPMTKMEIKHSRPRITCLLFSEPSNFEDNNTEAVLGITPIESI